MVDRDKHRQLHIYMDEQKLSVITHSLFSAWMLAFLFEGQILYALSDMFNISPYKMLFGGTASLLAGTFLCGFIIKTKKAAKQLCLIAYMFFIFISMFFFFKPSFLWDIGIIASSFLAGCCVAAWGFFLKSGTPKNKRLKTIADMLILSNVLMIVLNMAAIHISPYIGLALSVLMLLGAFVLAIQLPVNNETDSNPSKEQETKTVGITNSLIFLCIFVSIITIDSGLMYQVINPAFSHLEWLTSWYWALPYILALFVMRNLPQKINRTHILYIGIAMIGLSFIFFMGIKHTIASYLVINSLMLGAYGIYDFFWWSILGEMLDFQNNPARILGVGLSANLMGVLLGGIIGKVVTDTEVNNFNPVLLALVVVFVSLMLLPPLHNYLTKLMKNHAFLTVISETPEQEQTVSVGSAKEFSKLTERENQVAALLLYGKTYKKIAAELYISENTVKYYVKNIYSKLDIKNRSELIDIMIK
ncbi:MAG: helix-turn-helix transcriptional regulator [Clostridiaceae bacterium]|nr:helix-turn-helix transcriptional regulator [Clostridiaceae bacterium]